MRPAGKYSPQAAQDSDVRHARKSADDSVPLSGEGVRQERQFQVSDVHRLGLKRFASVQSLPHMGGFSCAERVAVFQVYNYTHMRAHTHTPKQESAALWRSPARQGRAGVC